MDIEPIGTAKLTTNAKELANKMADSINVKSNFIRSFASGALELPVDLYYLGYDFLDTEHRTINGVDKERCIRLIQKGSANVKSLEKIANIIIRRYLDKINVEKLKNIAVNGSGHLAGSVIANRLILGNVGGMFASNLATKMVVGFSFSAMLSFGALMSRAVYSSRELSLRDPELYSYLRRLGDLDLLYFLIEKRVRPFEDATSIWHRNRQLFDEVAQYFFQKVKWK
ncbi:hypothetical protein [Serratia sp. 1D1416]|uniref:hypothetical protein n=1 Tax=Serratia sp. 1D1416 TaxID=2447890 RepID=UPI001013CC36|nr:hypothetical protein [Serratia sp. 1D1416]